MTHELKTGGDRGYLRIATEEAFATAGTARRDHAAGERRPRRQGHVSLWGFYGTSASERTTFIRERLLDLGPLRIQAMDDAGIDKAVLALTSPGMQSMHDRRRSQAHRPQRQRPAQGRLREISRPLLRHDRRSLRTTPNGRPRNSARQGGARLPRRAGQQPHPRPLSRRGAVRSDPARLRRSRPAALHPPAGPARRDDRRRWSRPGSKARCSASGSRPAYPRAAPADDRRVRPLSRRCS